MLEQEYTLEQLRDVHLELALKYESYARTTEEGGDVWYYVDKSAEAFDAALTFERLISEGATEVPSRKRLAA